MNEDPHREWSPEERRALESLRRDETPGPAFERRVVEELRGRGLLKGAGRTSSSRRWLAAAAIFFFGILSGALLVRTGESLTETAVSKIEPGPHFILLLYEDESYRDPVAGHEQERVAEYASWIGSVAADGRWASGAELSEAGTLLRPDGETGSPTSTRGTPGSSVGSLTGYFIYEAPDLDQAAKIAATCPHLRYGGSISVRALDG